MMGQALQAVRSVIFIGQMYFAMAVIAVAFAPVAAFRRDVALLACHVYCRWVCWTADWMVGLRTEVRGPIPDGAVLVAAKHQSFLDIIMIFGAMPRPRFVMKKQLMVLPFLGWYARWIDCIPVDRGKRGAAVKDMARRALVGHETGAARQTIIYPQGTRVAPGVSMPYKVGAAVLYEQLGLPCAPVAVNVGLFWPKRSMFRKPGLAVVEFLPILPAGLDKRDFLIQLEQLVETHSDRLMAEAGFTLPKA